MPSVHLTIATKFHFPQFQHKNNKKKYFFFVMMIWSIVINVALGIATDSCIRQISTDANYGYQPVISGLENIRSIGFTVAAESEIHISLATDKEISIGI